MRFINTLRVAALAALLPFAFGVAAQSITYAGYTDNSIRLIATPTSTGQAFCQTDPNIVFAISVSVNSPISVGEDAGLVNRSAMYTLVAYCDSASASSLQPVSVVFGTATLGSDVSLAFGPAQPFTSLNQFDAGDVTLEDRSINILEDQIEEPTESYSEDLLAEAILQPGSRRFVAPELESIDSTVQIIDNDGAPPPGADLAISQSNNAPTPLVVGSVFQKTITVINNGPTDASNASVGDNLPAQLALVNNDCNAIVNGQFVGYQIATLSNGSSHNCTLTVEVVGAGSVVNEAMVGNATPADPNSSNDITSEQIGTAIANQPPVVTNGSASTMNGQSVVIDLSARATDPEGGPLAFAAVSQPTATEGSLSVTGSTATFTPAPGFEGTVLLRFEAVDDAENAAAFQVEVTVTANGVNQPPIAMDGSAVTSGTSSVSIDLLSLVSDPEGDALSFEITSAPPASQGTATLAGNTLIFTPLVGYEGSTVVGLSASDATHPPAPFTVTVTVTGNPANQPPTGMSGSAQSSGGVEVSVALTPLFTDPDGDPLTFALATPASNGTARVVGAIAFYVPNAGFTGSDQFQIRATDPAGLSTTVTILVTVTANLDPGQTAGTIQNALDSLPNNGSAVAQAAVIPVANACGNADPASGAISTCQAIVAAANANNAAGVQDALENLAAEEVSAQSNVASELMSQQKANVATRMAAVRGGASGFDLAGLSLFSGGSALSIGMLPLEGFGAAGLALDDQGARGSDTGLRPSPWGVFVNGSIGGGNRRGSANESGFDFDNYGVTAGVDYRLNDRAFVGLALGYSASDVDLDANSGNLETDGIGATAYASWYGENGWYVDTSLGYFRNDYEQLRMIDLSSIGLTREAALSETKANQLVATLGVGYEFARNGWLLTPEFRIEYAGTDIDAFEERGSNDSGFLLSFPSQDFQSLQFSGALQVARAISTSNGVVQPFVRVDWFYESDNDGFTLIPRLRSNPSQPFAQIVIDDPDRNFGSFSGGLSWVRPGGTQFYLSIFRTFAYDDLEQWVLRGGLRWEF